MSTSLCIKPSGREDKPWAFVIRSYDGIETNYTTITHLSDELAQAVVEAGENERGPYWLFGEPDWVKLAHERKVKKARELIAVENLRLAKEEYGQ